jgi:putative endonuclease
VSTHTRKQAYYRGIVAEYLCIIWLILKGYSILARRYKHHHGEIDVIALRGHTIVCVEVKARARREDALASITHEKRQRTERAASAFIASHQKFLHHNLRFDVMMVTSYWRIHHLTNAWSTT